MDAFSWTWCDLVTRYVIDCFYFLNYLLIIVSLIVIIISHQWVWDACQSIARAINYFVIYCYLFGFEQIMAAVLKGISCHMWCNSNNSSVHVTYTIPNKVNRIQLWLSKVVISPPTNCFVIWCMCSMLIRYRIE